MTKKEYNKVLKLGCGHYTVETSFGTEHDCEWGYSWSCDDCPIVVEKENKTAAALPVPADSICG